MTSKFLFTLLFTICFSLASFGQNKPRLASINISGNDKTEEQVILRELLFHIDSFYTEKHLEELIINSENRVLNLNLFLSVTISHSTINERSIDISIVVDEKWYTWPIPFVEFSDRNLNVWRDLDFSPDRTNYGLYLFQYNLFGKNHTLKAGFKKGYNTEIGLEYRVPFLSAKSNWGVAARVDFKQQNEVWLNTLDDQISFYKNGDKNLIQTSSIEGIISNRFNPFTSLEAYVAYEIGNLDTGVVNDRTTFNDYFLNSEASQNTFTAEVASITDKRNNIYFPTTGFYLRPSVGLSHFSNSTNLSSIFFAFEIQKFSKLPKRFYSALSMKATTNTETYIPYSQRKMLGYDNTIRGFEKYVIDGSMGFLSNAAIRYELINNKKFNTPFIPLKNYKTLPVQVYLELYTDAGMAIQQIPEFSNKLPNQFLYSVGLGINTIVFNDRVLRLEYSYNSLQEGGFFVHLKKAI